MAAVYKDDGALELRAQIMKAERFDELGELTAVVYAPDLVDSQGDFAEAEVIKQMAYDAMREGVEIDIRHNEEPVGRDRAFVAESFIIQKGDPRFQGQVTYDGDVVDVAGGWGVTVKIEDEALRKSYGEDGWQGISLGGTAVVEEVQEQTKEPAAFQKEFKAKKQETDMDPKDLAKAISEANQPVLEAVAAMTKAVEGITKSKTEGEPEKKVEKKADLPDPTDKAAVKAHLDRLTKEKLLAKVDWDDADSVSAYYEELAKAQESTEARNRVPSNQGTTGKSDDDDRDTFYLGKSDDDNNKGSEEAVQVMLKSLGLGKEVN